MRKTLEFTVKAACPIQCSFCPQDKLKGAYKGVEKELTVLNFIHVLSKLPKDCRVDLSGFVEPLINPETPRFIQIAKGDGFDVELYTTLVGMTAKGADIIYRAQPNNVRIHVPDQKAMLIPDAKWINLHNIWHSQGLRGSYMAMGEPTPAVAEHLKSHGITVELPTMLSRGGNLWERPEINGKLRCHAERWHQNVMMPNGDVYLDCMDYGMSCYLGNLFNQPYSDIYHAAEMLRCKAEQGHAVPEICKQCEWAAAI